MNSTICKLRALLIISLSSVLISSSNFILAKEKMRCLGVMDDSHGLKNEVVEMQNILTETGTNSLNGGLVYLSTKATEENEHNKGFIHYKGELYGGGVIFYVWKDTAGVENGLIVALTDQSNSQVWSNVTSTLTGAAQNYWDGMSNTNAIVQQKGHTSSAASLALAHNGGGFNDWYLPSIDELGLLYNNRDIVNKTLSGTSGATAIGYNYYWSSSEYKADNAWQLYFSSVMALVYLKHISPKNTAHHVRAIRAFKQD